MSLLCCYLFNMKNNKMIKCIIFYKFGSFKKNVFENYENFDIILRKCFKENLSESKLYVMCNEDI